MDFPQNIDPLTGALTITMLGLVVYYFGRVISDSRFKSEEKQATYVIGLAHFLIFIATPGILVYSLIMGAVSLNAVAILTLVGEFVLVGILGWRFRAITSVVKVGLRKRTILEWERRATILVRSIAPKASDDTIEKFVKKWVRKASAILLYNMRGYTVFVINALAFLITISFIMAEFDLFYQYLSVVMLYLLSTLAAFLLSFDVPKPCELILENESIKGELVKIEPEFITIHQEGKVYNVSKDRVKMIRRQSYDEKKMKEILKEE